ncbi:MAG: UbiX family flavin prenyltransferase [Deltaproteobacteria bacterium]|nr:UbiX family flavin prenyltransferase [Deltaproteobacteria bacterium]
MNPDVLNAGRNRYVVALTGASGMIYARELLAYFQGRPDLELHCIISPAGEQVLALELGLPPRELAPAAVWHEADDFTSSLASGSFQARAMVVIPCTMGSLGAIAQGVGRHLVHRAGEVFLKEKRPLILVVRETPVSLVHLENMVRAARAGATVFPACPGFYHRPKTLEELARQFAGRVLDHLGLDHNLGPRWGEKK